MTSFSIVDVETTGLRPDQDRVIEIGIIRVTDNRVMERYQQLINPERPLPSFIQRHTGISDEMVVNAPTFADIFPTLRPLLAEALFVAHNASFDYGFIRSEYRRLGETFLAPKLCTVQLSRRLFPRYRRHGLDSIIERFNIPCPARHRALDDAEVVWQFLQHIQASIPVSDLVNGSY